MVVYRIRFDHNVDGSSIRFASNKKLAMKCIRGILKRFPYIKAELMVPGEGGIGWKIHSYYEYSINPRTGRWRLVKKYPKKYGSVWI